MQKCYVFILVFIAGINFCQSQVLDLRKTPTEHSLKEANQIVKTFFENLKNKDHEANVDFIVENLGGTWDESKKISTKNDYLNKFQIMSIKPPKGVYGDLQGFDIIDQGILPGSDRYFRNTYLGYFEQSVLIFEFRFYVTQNKKVRLNYIGWSEKNPFEYMSTADMLMSRYN
ncbi:hypothetical protein GCM10023115_24700 [Pontixanthobacter gangjinensis]|uniref:Nuclear transport factor 2 family protein n=1 Tax=Christiangramia aestuarii TaxID=1028746 RepID=A0A7K1LSZ2_9FLAO|nr:hypothetical protein [Christiangramia aestuarii]MUP43897.1 hypothetical protein [Christiangramia aestuarii]